MAEISMENEKKAQELYGVTPHYIVLSENGPDHAKVFHIAVFIGEEKIAEGRKRFDEILIA